MMETNINNNKRIAKNTAYLYIRMLFTAFLSLYTARLILQNLGVEDFGIYNVVGGIVTFMGFLNATLSSATQRFLTYNLGLKDSLRFRQTYSLLINIYLIFSAAVFVILEIAGPLYISCYMTISPERISAAHWVFQFSLLAFIFSTVTVPHRSSIVAYEKMGMYAYVGIVEAVLSFVSVLVIPYIDSDSLILYAVLMCLSQLIIAIVLVSYCQYRLPDCHYFKYWNSNYFKELLSYSGWNLFGSISSVLTFQGQAIVLNYFFGPVVNAAKAIADRVNSMISQFSNNFYMAVAPQIIKSYATENIEYMRYLVLNSSRYSFQMLFVISVPLISVMGELLNLWLGSEQVKSEMVLFCQWVVVVALTNILEQPITMAVRATGNIKRYQVYVGIVTLSFLPLCVFMFVINMPAFYSMILLSVINLIALIVRVKILSPIIHIKNIEYYKSVMLPLACVSGVVAIVLNFIQRFGIINDLNWILELIVVLLIACVACWIFGLKRNERKMLCSYVNNKLLKK